MSAAREYWRVLALHLRMRLSLSAVSAKGRKRSGRETAKLLGFGFIMLYAVAAVLLFYGLILYPFLKGAAAMGLEAPVMGLIVMVCMILVMVFGTMTLLSLVFGAKDAEFYAALPLREQSVFAAKFTMAYGAEAAMSAVFLWPAVIIYGMVTGAGAPAFLLLILRALPVWLLLPIAPMAVAALISMLFTRLTALSKHRDAMMMAFGMILVMGMVVGQGLLGSRLTPVLSDEAAVMDILSDNSRMIRAVTGALPPAEWCAQALVGSARDAAFGYLGMLGTVTAGAAVCLLLSRRLYYKGVLAQLEAPKGKTKGFKKDSVRAGNPLMAFFSKEMRTILRSPVYAMNTLAGIFIFPLMIGVSSFSVSGSGVMLRGFLDTMAGGNDVLYLVAAGIVMLMSVMSVGVSTSFSREGKMMWLSQTAPVTARTQVAARLLGGFALSTAGAALTLAVMVALLGFSIWEALFGLVLGSCASFPLLAASLIPDAMRPKRKWNSEAEAMKQNFNSMLAMLLGLGLALVIGAAAMALRMMMPVWIAGIVVAVACLALGYGLFLYVSRLTGNMLATIDG